MNLIRPIATIASALGLTALSATADEPAPADEPEAVGQGASPLVDAARKEVELPGLLIRVEERCIDVEGSVCLDEGTLELVACTRDSKEHESIVAAVEIPSTSPSQQAGAAAKPTLELASPFVDHAIIQRGMGVRVWGWAEPGCDVTVTFAGQSKAAFCGRMTESGWCRWIRWTRRTTGSNWK